jgi:hypothetical protein
MSRQAAPEQMVGEKSGYHLRRRQEQQDAA